MRRASLARAAVLFALAGAVPGCRQVGPPTPESSFARDLDALQIERRLTEGPLWGAARYASWGGNDRGTHSRQSPAVVALAARTQQAYLDGHGSLGDYGLAVAAAGDLDEGIESLESAARGESRRAEWLTDLAALYLQRNHPVDIVRALDASARASMLAAGHPAPLVSTALALGRAHLVSQASATWKTYLTINKDPGWQREAEAALVTLSAGISTPVTGDLTLQRATDLARTDPEQARVQFETRALVDWARRCRAGDAAASSPDLLGVLARGLRSSTGDMFYDRVAADLKGVHCGTATAGRYARAIDAYVSGRRKYEADDPTGASADFERARQTLAAASTPLVAMPEFYLAVGQYYSGHSRTAEEQLERALRAAARNGFRNLEARCFWMRGVIKTSQARYSEALDDYGHALRGYREMGDRQNAASVQSLRATVYEQLGEFPSAWNARLESLTQIATLSERRQHTALTGAARSAVAQHLPGAARFFADEAVTVASRWNRGGARIEAFILRARAELQLGQPSAAIASLKSARSLLSDIPDATARGIFEAEVLLCEGETLASSDPAAARAALDAVLPRLEAAGAAQERARAYLALGRAAARAGDSAAAAAAFESGIDTLEHQRQYLNPAERVSAFDQTWQLFPEMAKIELSRTNPDRILRLWERARARALAEAASAPEIPDTARLRPVPPDIVVLYYAVLPDRLLSWSLESGMSSFATHAIAETDLESTVLAFRRGIRSGGSTTLAASKRLSELLIAPHAQALRRHSTIVVVPDASLHDLPFAALTDAGTGRMLVQSHTIITAPSLRMFAAIRDRTPARPALGAALLVAVPNTSDNGVDLPALPHASDEVDAIHRLLPDAQVLIGAPATRERFLALARDRSVIHYAGHAIVERDYPVLSRLLFYAESSGNGRLLLSDIAAKDFTRLSLVVLSACETATGHVYRGEGPTTLARPFLAAGASSVIGSLWPVPDADTGAFFRLFYERLAAGESPASALRLAQLAAIERGGIRTSAWSAFTSIGAW